jgi:2-phosphoglycerate kinase
MTYRSWDVLLVCGPSGAGKSSLAYPLAFRSGTAIVEVDDIVEALKAVTTAEMLPAVHFWDTHPDAVHMSPAEIVAQGLEITRELEPAVLAVIENHLETDMPVVIEGDFLDPKIADRFDRRVAAVVIVDDEDQILANYLAREPSAGPQAKRAAVSAEWARWYATGSGRAAIVAARPWDTLIERVAAAVSDRDSAVQL